MKKDKKIKVGTISVNINTPDFNYGAMLHSWAFIKYMEKLDFIEHAEVIDYLTPYLENRKEQLEKQIQTIKAPIDGYVNKVQIHTIGGVVTPAQELMTIVPKDSKLVIKAKVMNQDIGFIDEGMDVSIKIDTFNFQKYGILKGVVTLVGVNSIEDERLGPVYEVYIRPEDTTLMVEGKEQSIKSGMSSTNEINIGKRRIIEFFIYPLIKYLDESIKVR